MRFILRSILLSSLVSLMATTAFAANDSDISVKYTIQNRTGQPLIVSSFWEPRCNFLTLSPQLHSGDIIPEGDTVLVGDPQDGYGGNCSYNFVTTDNAAPEGRIHIKINATRSNPYSNISSWGNLGYVGGGVLKGYVTITKH